MCANKSHLLRSYLHRLLVGQPDLLKYQGNSKNTVIPDVLFNPHETWFSLSSTTSVNKSEASFA